MALLVALLFSYQLNKQALELQHKMLSQHPKLSSWQVKIKLCKD